MSEQTLEQRLGTILKNIVTRLSKSEITENDYHHLVFAQLSEQEILTKRYNFISAKITGELGTRLQNKLSTKQLIGIENNYILLKDKPLSRDARDDVDKYETLVNLIVEHVRDTLNGEKTDKKEISEIAMEYISKLTPELDPIRRGYLLGSMTTQLDEFKRKTAVATD